MRTKFYIVLTLSVLLVAFAIYGIATSIGSCREWTAFSLDTNVTPRVLYSTQKLLFIAYNWMAVALIAIITSAALIIWYVMRQIKLYPELRIFLTNSPELEYKKLKVDTYGNNVTYGRSTLKSRRQVTLLLDYLIKRENHTIHYLQLNDIYQTNFYDGSPGARRKVSNLKFEINDLLKDTPFSITKPSSDELALSLTKTEQPEEPSPGKSAKKPAPVPPKAKENAPSTPPGKNGLHEQPENHTPGNTNS